MKIKNLFIIQLVLALSLSSSSLSWAGGNEVALETVELVHEGLTIEIAIVGNPSDSLTKGEPIGSASKNQFAIETVELAHEGITFEGASKSGGICNINLTGRKLNLEDGSTYDVEAGGTITTSSPTIDLNPDSTTTSNPVLFIPEIGTYICIGNGSNPQALVGFGSFSVSNITVGDELPSGVRDVSNIGSSDLDGVTVAPIGSSGQDGFFEALAIGSSGLDGVINVEIVGITLIGDSGRDGLIDTEMVSLNLIGSSGQDGVFYPEIVSMKLMDDNAAGAVILGFDAASKDPCKSTVGSCPVALVGFGSFSVSNLLGTTFGGDGVIETQAIGSSGLDGVPVIVNNENITELVGFGTFSAGIIAVELDAGLKGRALKRALKKTVQGVRKALRKTQWFVRKGRVNADSNSFIKEFYIQLLTLRDDEEIFDIHFITVGFYEKGNKAAGFYAKANKAAGALITEVFPFIIPEIDDEVLADGEEKSNKADLTAVLASRAGIPKVRAANYINILTEAIQEP